MTPRDRFFAALRGLPVDRRPVWLMRQAGRYLPEYRAVRARRSFLEMVKTPELAAQITLQPVERFPLSAAILFSDILTVPEALGFPYAFREGGGIRMERRIARDADIDTLAPEGVCERLDYVYAAMAHARAALGGDRALIGFAGAPWTLAAYLIQGESADGFPALAAFAQRHEASLLRLLDKLTDAVADHLAAQAAAGADALQLFDSWAGLCPSEKFARRCAECVRRIVARLPENVPLIYFAKGVVRDDLWATGARALSFGADADLPACARRAPAQHAVQGNLAPEVLLAPPPAVADAVRRLLDSMRGARGYVVNLGHGVLPQTAPEAVAALVETVNATPVASEAFLREN